MKFLQRLLIFCGIGLSLFLLSCSSSEAPVNLREAKRVSRGESRQGVGLYRIYQGSASATEMVLMNKHHGEVLARVPIRHQYASEDQPSDWVEVVWNAEGTAVAIHDSLDRDSKLMVYRRRADGGFQRVPLPEFTVYSVGHYAGTDRTIRRWAEKPLRWLGERLLVVEFRYVGKQDNRLYFRKTLSFEQNGQFGGFVGG
ncbi:hypothetical protein [Roseibacillus ishigakijimensis]|nr:hypothetical protein [Roseibacillus ishigakijimensis]